MVNERIVFIGIEGKGGGQCAPLLQKENQEIKKPIEETGFPVKLKIDEVLKKIKPDF